MATPFFCPARAAFVHTVDHALLLQEPKVHLIWCMRRIGKTKTLQNFATDYDAQYVGHHPKQSALKSLDLDKVDKTRPLVVDEACVVAEQEEIKQLIKDHKSTVVIAMTPDDETKQYEWNELADVVYSITYSPNDGQYGFQFSMVKGTCL